MTVEVIWRVATNIGRGMEMDLQCVLKDCVAEFYYY